MVTTTSDEIDWAIDDIREYVASAITDYVKTPPATDWDVGALDTLLDLAEFKLHEDMKAYPYNDAIKLRKRR